MSHLDRVLGAARPPQDTTTASVVVFSRDDIDLIVELACSLNEKPGKNWVERSGGLPDYVCRIARAVRKTGKTTSQAIAIAVSRVKKWATGAGVDADTQAKAVKALAQWEKLKVKNKAKKVVAASMSTAGAGEPEVLCLANSYNTEIVRRSFENREREARKAWRAANANASYEDGPGHLWVRELWTDFLIVDRGYGTEAKTYKVTYSVDDNLDVSFGDPVEVKTTYVTVDSGEMVGDDLSDADLLKMMDLSGPCAPASVTLALPLSAPAVSALDKVLALAANGKAKPYANTKAKRYADAGYQSDGKQRYALDTADQVRAAWSYINQADNAAKYSPGDLAKVKTAIKRAAKAFGITISDA